jgi:hypothetical protein
MNRFAVQSGYNGREAIALFEHCAKTNDKFSYRQHVKDVLWNETPVGSVEWMQRITGTVKPKYFPEFLAGLVKRKYWIANQVSFYKISSYISDLKDVFIKPLNGYKDFHSHRSLPCSADLGIRFPFLIQEIVEFHNEWRIYVADGKILDTCWYKGKDEDKNSPVRKETDDRELFFIKNLVVDGRYYEIPSDWCGTIDIGETDDGIQLVECHCPFSCGWYGNDSSKYAEFIVKGWEYMRRLK